MTEAWLAERVSGFWEAAGGPTPFPRDLEASALWALPLAVDRMAGLRVDKVRAWLRRAATPIQITEPDRALRGCLVAYAGKGVVLIDRDDPEEERRFSLAHEVAHFLVDYLAPRRRVLERLGSQLAAVLDGRRPATLDERADALLSGVPLGVHAHLLRRAPDGSIGCGQVMAAESRADRLALELLAPAATVRALLERRRRGATSEGRTGGGRGRAEERAAEVAELLVERFGLPGTVAASYGRWLAYRWYGEPSVREWLGM